MKRSRMSAKITLVLLGSLPAVSGCGGCSSEPDTYEEEVPQPPPSGPEMLIGAPFVAWWGITHPPILRMVKRPSSTSRTSHTTYRRGRSAFLSSMFLSRSSTSSSSSTSTHSSSSSVSRGGFGSHGHSASASS